MTTLNVIIDGQSCEVPVGIPIQRRLRAHVEVVDPE